MSTYKPYSYFLLAICCAVIAGSDARAQNPYTLRCDTVDVSQYPKIILRIGVDSLANPITDLHDSDFLVIDKAARIVPHFIDGSCSEDSLSLMMVMDESRSMGNFLGSGTKLSAAKTAAQNFLNRLGMPPDEAALLGFSDNQTLLQDFTTNRSLLLAAVSNLSLIGGTDIADPVSIALAKLKMRKGKRVMLLMTDGVESTGNRFKAGIGQFDATAKADSITIYTIGLYPNNDADRINGEPPLRQLALGSGGMYYLAPTAQQLIAIYDSIYYRLLSGYCNASFSTIFLCDSGPRNTTIIFHRGIYADTCEDSYIAPPPPNPKCQCVSAAYVTPTNLMPAYPNPVTGTQQTMMQYRVDREGPVLLTVFNMLGQAVSTPVNEFKSPGLYQVEFSGADLPAGMYFYRLVAGGTMFTRSLTVSQ